MQLNKYCFDTHTLVWYFIKRPTLSTRARQILNEVFEGKKEGIIPSLVLVEALHVSFKVKEFNFGRFLSDIRIQNLTVVPLEKEVLQECYKLSKVLNIHDRIIVATAIVTGSVLITKDKIIRSLKNIRTIW
ncbi:hypothetical protein A2803_02475 [Candidatus Woesebacteria bacterium RIFCSPHIGHO2_01_FULL_44_21]|uniref:PIN domain-containing protein n=1 Tax=Candidatus Woesebacteria bacterium RIFCSPHIGHO2_01_FULL_44_21 TaxID=1802503 RepID=A0A1F7Z0C4_9BACT|nr:MAG: hypothetical protein A2803_02475 [Candidatus Woesebacteria bacterium RIFCSPHIGHO2_01_FULL_44_21]OGM71567.1 MAG: hypothetical protein A2897_01470 [Candidatus Woesebacteria bacterium RIFCSPLOWO2_01_FULL_44_24b]